MSFGEAHTTRLQKGIFAGQAESHNPERLAVPFDDKQCLAVRRACLVGNAGRAVPLVAPPRLHHLSGEEPLSSSVPITVSTRSSNSPSRTSRKEQDSSTVPRGLQRQRCLGGPGRSWAVPPTAWTGESPSLGSITMAWSGPTPSARSSSPFRPDHQPITPNSTPRADTMAMATALWACFNDVRELSLRT